MYEIVKKKVLNPTVTLLEVQAPLVARAALPGQFVIVRANEEGERIPLTVAGSDPQRGTITIIFQLVGAATMALGRLEEGERIGDLAGPLGSPSRLEGLKKAAVIGGGVGCAIAWPVAKALFAQGCQVDAVVGFRTAGLVILEEEFRRCSQRFRLMTDDGSAGEKGLVTQALRELLAAGERYDEVIAIGPLVMMKYVCALTREFGVKTVVSMNPIMIDGTGMCGCCRLTVGGKTRFACVEGPDFDGHQVDFDEAIQRASLYREFEGRAREASCKLFEKEAERHG